MGFDRTAVENHVALLHQLAGNCGNGVLVLCPIWENRNVCAQKFGVGRTREMIEAIMAHENTWGVNLYAPYVTMRESLDPGKKGGERDVEYVFAAVADIDNDEGKAAQREIDIEPSYIVESSPGNFQRVYLFEKPLPAIEAKPVLVAFHAAIGGDSAQRDCSHVWRVPGTLNWPTKSKLARGRPEEPAPVRVVKACNGVRVDPAALLALAPAKACKPVRKSAKRKAGDASTPADAAPSSVFDAVDLPEFEKTKENTELLRSALPHIPADDRGVWLKILAALKTLEPAWGPMARAVADWWSKTSPKFDPAEQEKAWASLNAERLGGVTVLTLFYLAREYGWVDPRRAEEPLGSRHRRQDDGQQEEGEGAPKITSFIKGESGQILRNHPQNTRFAGHKLGIRLRLNEFSTQTEITGLPGFDGELTDAGAIRLRFLIHEVFGFLPPAELFNDVLIDIAHANRFHPVRDWLNSLAFDGVPRIDTWLIDHAGAEDTPFNRAVGRLFLIAAVRRVRQPGVKFDTMLVLESRQGKDKSKTLRALAVRDEWFTDCLPLSADTKELIERTSGVWIVECADLSGMARRDVNHVKSLLSCQEDRARKAYARRSQRVPRQFVMAGTTNDSQYLLDEENRRFWPVAVTLFDFEAVRRIAPQLWAEAAFREAAGESITLDGTLWQAATAVQGERQVENPVLDRLIGQYGLDEPGWIKPEDVWTLLEIPVERRRGLQRAVGSALQHEMGFRRVRLRSDDKAKGRKGQWYYERGFDGSPWSERPSNRL